MQVPDFVSDCFPPRPVDSHKYSVGTVAVVGGSPRFSHAPVICGLGARAAGAGLVHLVEWIFIISGGCTFAYMLKLFICVFVEKNKDPGRQERYDRAGSYMKKWKTWLIR